MSGSKSVLSVLEHPRHSCTSTLAFYEYSDVGHCELISYSNSANAKLRVYVAWVVTIMHFGTVRGFASFSLINFARTIVVEALAVPDRDRQMEW